LNRCLDMNKFLHSIFYYFLCYYLLMLKFIAFFCILFLLAPIIFIAGGVEALLKARHGELPFLLLVEDDEEY